MIDPGEQVLEGVSDALDRGDLDAGAADAAGTGCSKLSMRVWNGASKFSLKSTPFHGIGVAGTGATLERVAGDAVTR